MRQTIKRPNDRTINDQRPGTKDERLKKIGKLMTEKRRTENWQPRPNF